MTNNRCQDCWHFASWADWIPDEGNGRDFLCVQDPKWIDAVPGGSCEHWLENSDPCTNNAKTQEKVSLLAKTASRGDLDD